MNRVRSVDMLRGFALAAMVLVHLMIYFGNEAAADTWIYFTLNDVLADWGAAGFLMMMGASQVLSAAKPSNAAAGNPFLFKKAALRAAFLFVVGLLMLLVAFGPAAVWRWDILTLMGFGTLVLFFCRFLPSWLIITLSAAVLLVTPLLRTTIDVATGWGGGFVPTPFISDYIPGILVNPLEEYEVVWELGAIIKGFLLTGEFPVFPWIAFPLIGFVVGRRIIAQRLKGDLPLLLVVGVLLAGLGLGGAALSISRPDANVVTDYIVPLCFYPDSFTMSVTQMGVALVVFGLMYYWFDARPRAQDAPGFMATIYNRTSRFSLTFYTLHYMLIGWPLAIIYFRTGEYRVFDLMGAWPAFACGLAAVILLELLLAVWERAGGRYSLEWILAALTAKLVRPERGVVRG